MSERIITPEAVASYPWIAEPQTFVDPDTKVETKKYTISFVFLKETDISGLQRAVLVQAREKWGAGVTVGKKRYTFKEAVKEGIINLPFRTDWEVKGYPEGSTFINTSSKKQPGVVSLYADPKTGKAKVLDPTEVYPGAIVRASLTPFTYGDKPQHKGNKGVSFGLNGIQFIRDGERLDNFVAAEDEFDAEEAPAADLSDLEEETVAAGAEDDDSLDDLLS